MTADSDCHFEFVLMSGMKSGSTYLKWLVEQHHKLYILRGQLVEVSDAGIRLRQNIEYDGTKTMGFRRNLKFAQRDLYVEGFYAHNPRMKFICALRDPIDRLYSQYRHVIGESLREGQFHTEPAKETRSEYVFDFNKDVNEFFLGHSPFLAAIEYGKYGTQLRSYLDRFPIDQFHIFPFEEVAMSPARTVSSVWKFLGLEQQTPRTEAFPKVINRDSHQAVTLRGKRPTFVPPTEDTRMQLRDYYERSVVELSMLAGRDFQEFWLKPSRANS